MNPKARTKAQRQTFERPDGFRDNPVMFALPRTVGREWGSGAIELYCGSHIQACNFSCQLDLSGHTGAVRAHRSSVGLPLKRSQIQAAWQHPTPSRACSRTPLRSCHWRH